MITQNLSTLKIHKLTQEQYDRELAAGRIDENALYLTPDEEIDLTPYATKDEVATKADAEHSHEISDVTDLQSTLDVMEDELRGYTDTKIADLINSAPTTLDTLGEIADAMEENADVVEALHNAVGAKANASDLTAHSGNKENPHEVTAEQLGLGNIENKSSAMIREEITAEDVSNALGFEPADAEEVSIQLEATNNMLPLVVEMITTTVDGQSTYSLADGWTYATLKEQWDTGRMVCLRNGSAVYHLSDSSSTRLLFYKLSIFNYTSGAVGITGYLVYPDGRVLATTSSWYQPKYYQIGYYSGEWKFTSTSTTYSTILTYINSSTTTVCLYRSLNDGTRQVYYFNRKVVLSDGSVELYFYCIMGTQLYQHIIRSDNTMSNGYMQLITSSTAVGKKGTGSHAEIFNDYTYSQATGEYAHAEGFNTKATGDNSHTEGWKTEASGKAAHTEGTSTMASAYHSHAEGTYTTASGSASHAEGRGAFIEYTITGDANATTYQLNADTVDDWYLNFILYNNKTYTVTNYDETTKTITVDQTLSETALSEVSVRCIANGLASGETAHSEGYWTIASGACSHAEGYLTRATNYYAHSEGANTLASHYATHAEGMEAKATGEAAHAEGKKTTASDKSSHAEGLETKATGEAAHAEGYKTTASGKYSHAEGTGAVAYGQDSHAEGTWTSAQSDSQHVQGKYNIKDSSGTYAHIVGNGTGTATSARSNAHTLDWSGNAWYAGNIKLGGTSYNDAHEVALKVDIEDMAATKADSVHTHIWDELENRPFGEREEIEIRFSGEDSGELVSNTTDQGGIYVDQETYIGFIPEIGKKYKVTWDGVEYDCLCSDVNTYDDRVLGNPALYSDNPNNMSDPSKPFTIVVFNDASSYCIITTQSGSHTVRVREYEEVLVTKIDTLDERFIPDTIARKSDLANAMPSVTTADNGKFLRVVDGVWAATTVPRAEDLEV